jgi:hypothetical protein
MGNWGFWRCLTEICIVDNGFAGDLQAQAHGANIRGAGSSAFQISVALKPYPSRDGCAAFHATGQSPAICFKLLCENTRRKKHDLRLTLADFDVR